MANVESVTTTNITTVDVGPTVISTSTHTGVSSTNPVAEVIVEDYVLSSGGMYSGQLNNGVPAWLDAAISAAVASGTVDLQSLVADLTSALATIQNGVNQSISAIQSEVESQASLITATKSELEGNIAANINSVNTRVDGVEAVASNTNAVVSTWIGSDGGNLNALVVDQITTRAADKTATANSLSVLGAVLNDATGQIAASAAVTETAYATVGLNPDGTYNASSGKLSELSAGIAGLDARLVTEEGVSAGMFHVWDGVEAVKIGMIKFVGDIQYQYVGGTLGEFNDGWVRTDQSAQVYVENIETIISNKIRQYESASGLLNAALLDGKVTIYTGMAEPATPEAYDLWRIDKAYVSIDEWEAIDPETSYLADSEYVYKYFDGFGWKFATSNQVAFIKNSLELSTVRELADDKVRVFSNTPTVPYDFGDMWIKDGEIYKATVGRTTEYHAEDWVVATGYTQAILGVQESVSQQITNLAASLQDAVVDGVSVAAYTLDIANLNGRIDSEESARINAINSESLARIEAINARIAEEAALDGKITAEEDARIQAGIDLTNAYKNYIAIITKAISDGVLTADEQAEIADALTAVNLAKARFDAIENDVASILTSIEALTTDSVQYGLDIANLDGAITAEEAARVAAILAEQQARVSDIADRIDAEVLLDGKITAEEQARLAAVSDLDAAYKEYGRVIALALADGVLTAEEQAAISAAATAVEAAKARLTAIETEAAQLRSDLLDSVAATQQALLNEAAARGQDISAVTAAYQLYVDTVEQALIDGAINDAEQAAIDAAASALSAAQVTLAAQIDASKAAAIKEMVDVATHDSAFKLAMAEDNVVIYTTEVEPSNPEPYDIWVSSLDLDLGTRDGMDSDVYLLSDTLYRFYNPQTNSWDICTPNMIEGIKALEKLSDLLSLVDGKSRIFNVVPFAPYDVGDIWLTDSGEILKAVKTAAEGGEYNRSDWVNASKYTDDTVALIAKGVAEDAQESADLALNNVDRVLDNSILDVSEKPSIRKEFDVLVNEKAGIESSANNYTGTVNGVSYSVAAEKTSYINALVALGTYLNDGVAWTFSTSIKPAWISDANLNSDTNIADRDVFRSKFVDVYAARQAVLDKIASISKDIADSTIDYVSDVYNEVTREVRVFTADHTSTPAATGKGDLWVVSDWWYTGSGANYSTSRTGYPNVVKRYDGSQWYVMLYEVYLTSKDTIQWAGGASKLLIDPNTGAVTGWQFADGSNVESQFKINADTFIIANSTDSHQPFTIEGGISKFNGAVSFTNTDMSSYANSNISINSDGTLSGAGTGQVTVAGIGAETPAGAQSKADAARDAAILVADAAQSTADAAVISAAEANSKISEIANDSKFTPVEKTAVRKEFEQILKEDVQIRASASTYGISTTTYYNSLLALGMYLNNGTTWAYSTTVMPSWISDANLSVTTTIVGSTFRANFATYYDNKQILLKAIASAAKTLADAAQSTANTANTNALARPLPSEVAAAINNNTTTINGSKITTGSITAAQIAASTITTSNLTTGLQLVNGEVKSSDFSAIGGAGFRLKSNAAGTSTDPTIYGAYIKGGTLDGSLVKGSNIAYVDDSNNMYYTSFSNIMPETPYFDESGERYLKFHLGVRVLPSGTTNNTYPEGRLKSFPESWIATRSRKLFYIEPTYDSLGFVMQLRAGLLPTFSYISTTTLISSVTVTSVKSFTLAGLRFTIEDVDSTDWGPQAYTISFDDSVQMLDLSGLTVNSYYYYYLVVKKYSASTAFDIYSKTNSNVLIAHNLN